MMIATDPTVPVHRQPLFVVRPGDPTRDWPGIGNEDRTHRWYSQSSGGTWCDLCDRLVIRISGRGRFYRGRHRTPGAERTQGLTAVTRLRYCRPAEPCG